MSKRQQILLVCGCALVFALELPRAVRSSLHPPAAAGISTRPCSKWEIGKSMPGCDLLRRETLGAKTFRSRPKIGMPVGGDIEVKINGVVSAKVTNDIGRKKGHFGLQLHGGDEMHVEFRRGLLTINGAPMPLPLPALQ